MTESPTPMPPDRPAATTEELVQRTQQAILAGLDDILARQSDILVRQTRQMIFEAVERVNEQHTGPLADRFKAVLVETAEQVVRSQLGPVLDQARQTLLTAVDDLRRQQAEPLLDHTRQMVLTLIDEAERRYTAPLKRALESVLLEAVDRVWQRQRDSFQEMGRQMMGRFTEALLEQRQVMTRTLLETVREPINQVVHDYVPSYAHWFGRRVIDFALAGICLCLAAVFLSLGVVHGLEKLGLPPFGVYLLVGLADLLVGLVFFRKRTEAWARTAASTPPPAGDTDAPRQELRGTEHSGENRTNPWSPGDTPSA